MSDAERFKKDLLRLALIHLENTDKKIYNNLQKLPKKTQEQILIDSGWFDLYVEKAVNTFLDDYNDHKISKQTLSEILKLFL